MNTTMKIIKTGLIALFLSTTGLALGQSIDKTANGAKVQVGPSTAADAPSRTAVVPAANLANENRDVILFYNHASKPGLTLAASRTEDLTGLTTSRPANNFTHYRWFYMGQDNNAAIDGNSFASGLLPAGLLKTYSTSGDEKLVITGLTEGYHYFKVRGIINPDNITEEELCNVQEETYVVYVLPELAVTTTASVPIGKSFQYCETEANKTTPASGQTKVKIEPFYDFVRPNTPTASAFEVKYRWYAIKEESGSFVDVSDKATNPVSFTGKVELLTEGITTAGAIPAFYPQITGFGKYKIFVEVEYAVKDRNYLNADETTGRIRPHVIYRGFAKNGVDDMILTVTPTPGKPHITIESVND